MKILLTMIVSIAVTATLIIGYNSFTGTRAKSDDRSDTRTLRKQYDDLVLKNIALNTSDKTKHKIIKDLITNRDTQNARMRIKDAELASKGDQIERLLIKCVKLGNQYRALHNKTIQNKKYTETKQKKSILKKKSKAKKSRKAAAKKKKLLMNKRKLVDYINSREKLYKEYTYAKKMYKDACGRVSSKSRRSGTRKWGKYKSLGKRVNSLDKKIKSLRLKIANI